MNSSRNFHVFWIIFSIVTVSTLVGLFEAYTDAIISFEKLGCNHHAYMIYKAYDDQVDDRKNQDWVSRSNECILVDVEYEQNKPFILRF